jgi:hypothetical protein
MDSPWGFIEMGVILLFAIGWGILELVALRLDRKREEMKELNKKSSDPPS